ncbi:MAG: STAS domain-containing protein [Blastocatellia bacterium]|nr:STAS domain-containing protein [Blastocatellia bacterium]
MPLTTEEMNGVLVVTIHEKALDASSVKQFKTDMTPVLEHAKLVIFDLSQLEFVDSSGLGAILSCLRQLTGKGGDLKLCGMTKPVRALFELVRMHRIFDILNTREEALHTIRR